MANRRDALRGAARAIEALYSEIEHANAGAHAAAARISVFPNSPNVVAGRVRVWFEIRHEDEAVVDAISDRFLARIAKEAAAIGVRISIAVDERRAGPMLDPAGFDMVRSVASDLGMKVMALKTVTGHDALAIRSAHVLDDGKSLFLELPDLQPVNQIHLRLRVDAGQPHDMFGTIHKLAAPFTGFAGYRPPAIPKIIAAHPILADLAKAKDAVPNKWRKSIPNARVVTIEAGKNLSFSPRMLNVKAGEPIKLTFANPDVVPHNWALIKPGTLAKVGDLANRIITDPEAASRHYIPKTDDVLVYADIIEPGRQFSVFFQAPTEKGRYPFLCTFPGHWMIMNGILIVE
jgi:azurin